MKLAAGVLIAVSCLLCLGVVHMLSIMGAEEDMKQVNKK
jgi:hypothetical protein